MASLKYWNASLQAWVKVQGGVDDPSASTASAYFVNSASYDTLQEALNATPAGGICVCNGTYTQTSDLIIAAGKTLAGHNCGGHNAQDADSGLIRLASTATIHLGASAKIQGMTIIRNGLIVPSYSSSGFSGTAITVGGHDINVEDCMILGFHTAISSAGYGRHYIRNVKGDCLNGINISGSWDISRCIDCHFWPFVTSGYSGGGDNKRAGVGYYFHDTYDWGKATNCFSYGYQYGFKVADTNNVQLIGCGADGGNTNGQAGSIGFWLAGSANLVRLVACQAAAQGCGYYIDAGAGNTAYLSDCDGWGNAGQYTNASGTLVKDNCNF